MPSVKTVNVHVDISIDTSELDEFIKTGKRVLGEDAMRILLFREMRKFPTVTKKVLKLDVPHKYVAKSGEIGKAVKRARVQMDASKGVICRIPLKGQRRALGGNHIKVSGGVRGWAARQYKGNPYPLSANIMAAGPSAVPGAYVSKFAGNAPFRNTSAKRLNGVIFARQSKGTHAKIQKLVGISIPQMPMNQSRDEVENDLEVKIMDALDVALQKQLAKLK